MILRGWLYNLRASGKLLFPIFRDGSGAVQGIVPKAAVSEETFTTLKNLTLESSLIVTGSVREDSRAPSGVELDVQTVQVTHRIPEETPYPISRKEHGVDFLMEHRHLWLRTPRQAAILACARHHYARGGGVLRHPRFYAHRPTDSHAERLRRHQ